MKNKNLVALWNTLMMVLYGLCIGLFGILAYVSIFVYLPKIMLMVTGGGSIDCIYWYMLSLVVMGAITSVNHYVCQHIATRWTIKNKNRGNNEMVN